MSSQLDLIKKPLSLFVFLALVTVAIFLSPPTATAKEDAIDFYVVPETEYMPVAELITYLLEEELGWNVNKKIQYAQVGLKKTSDGEADLFLGMKLPRPGSRTWNNFAGKVCNLGPVYEDVVGGWAVPDYVPKTKLNSPEDLAKPEVMNNLNKEIIGIESESSLLENSRRIMDTVKGLSSYQLVKINEMVAISELNRAIRSKEWLLITLNRPSVPFSLYNTRFISELTDEKVVNLLARKDLMEKYPNRVTRFLSRFHLSIDLVNELTRLFDKRKRNAATKFVSAHPELVNYWLEGIEAL
ncbi:MAG: glycine betaine ABC transporter substrate-binding protein [Candidatus Bipolaricaulota bacterium]|nr:hypothetical protein [Candidatus Bipolaricaulota bacterium]MBS3791142.1 hypothetical protein [Candidatus Bipolaricaulota bacterium]